MLYVIEGKTANELFINVSKKLLEYGKIVEPRGLETKELVNVWLMLLDPRQSIVTLKERALKKEYLAAELAWYESGDLRVENIAKYSSFWNKLADSNNTVNSNYGFLALIEKHAGKSQYEWCLNSLSEDPYSRQAVINYNQPKHKYVGNKDFVCTVSQQFILRDGFLDSLVYMRSNDFIFGLSYDLPWFASLQLRLARDLKVNVGVYHHIVCSLHAYKRHYPMIEAIAQAVENNE